MQQSFVNNASNVNNTISINDLISFRLSKSGAYTLNCFNFETASRIIELTKLEGFEADEIDNQYKRDYKEGDLYECQVWKAFQIFGGENINPFKEGFCKRCEFDVITNVADQECVVQ